MPDSGKNQDSEQRKRAVLAAVLAVKRGFLSPDEAMGLLEQVDSPAARPGASQPSGGTTPQADTLFSVGPASPADSDKTGDASSLVVLRTPKPEREAFEKEVASIAADPEKTAQTLAAFGVAPTKAAPALDRESVKQTLLAVAATTNRLPAKSASGRLAEVREWDKRYEVKSELARGGMGRVLIALDNAVGREVALKELLPGKSGTRLATRATTAGELVDRFLREAKVTGQLEHPNIVPVYEIGTRDDGSVFYTMKLVRGKTLAEHIRAIQEDAGASPAGRLARRLKLLDAFINVCDALAYAHARGVIHRDLKPANIMLGDYGETLVLDWGLARVQGQVDAAAARKKHDTPNFSPSLLGTDSESRTLDGSIIGTPAYMPPEQARGDLADVDEKSDVYALGAVLYEIIGGKPPYEGASANLILGQVQNLPPTSLLAREVLAPRDLVALVEKAMAREKSARLASAQALGAEVRAFREGRQLSVYRYSRSERARRFVMQNKLAASIALLAFVALGVVGTVSFLNVMNERDAAQVQLARAEEAERKRLDLERLQKEERENLISVRRGEVDQQRKFLQGLDQAGSVDERARKRADEFKLIGSQDGVTPEMLATNRALVSDLLAVCAAREKLLALLTEPIAGKAPELARAPELQALHTSVENGRLLAALLARLSEDFALAQFILDGTNAEPARLEVERQALEQARGALLKRHAALINETLSRLRADRATAGSNTGEFNEMVSKLSALRDRQTVEMLAAALVNLTKKAKSNDQNRLWTQPERDEITLICRVLSNMELPGLTVPPLSEFLDAVNDDRLAMEAAIALCVSGDWRAEAPVIRARKRFEHRALFWSTVGRLFARIPDPPVETKPRTAAEFVERAFIRTAKDKTKGKQAWDDLSAAILLEPENAQLYLTRASLGMGIDGQDLADLRRALEIDPKLGRAYVRMALMTNDKGDQAQAWSLAQKAIELDPAEPTGWGACAWFCLMKHEYAQAVHYYSRAIELNPFRAAYYVNRSVANFSLKQYDRVIVDCTSALDLDPYFQEAWVNRASARQELGDLEGALGDATRIIELAPRYGWGYARRGDVLMQRREFVGAEYDYARAVEFVGPQSDFHLRHVLTLRALRRYADAIRAAETYATQNPVQARVQELRSMCDVLQLESRGSLNARPDEVTGLTCFECCAVQLGEIDRAPKGAKLPRRLALKFALRGLATLPKGDEGNQAKTAALLMVAELQKQLREDGFFAEIDALGQALQQSGLSVSSSEAYNIACATALAAEATAARRFKVLGDHDGEATQVDADQHSLSEPEVGQRAGALRDKAFYWLQKAVDLGFKNDAHARNDADLTCLREDPRFESTLAKMR